MSKRDSISRFNLIIKLLKRKHSAFEAIRDYLEKESFIQMRDFNISKRTFQRDLADIREIFNIDIRYDLVNKVYYIDSNINPEYNDRLLEAFDTYNLLNMAESLSDIVFLERRQTQGTEHLYGLLHAIRNQVKITFIYVKFWDEKPTQRNVNPLALKEFRNRWYLMAVDRDDNQIKSFGLDRMSDLGITREKFKMPGNFDTHRHFRYCFGIVSPNHKEPTELVLSFTPFEGKYIKTLPLHQTQEILIDNKKEVRIKLTIFITHDLLMEILSFGDSVQVIHPPELVEEIVATYKSALKQYKA